MSGGLDLLTHELRPARGEPQGALVLLPVVAPTSSIFCRC